QLFELRRDPPNRVEVRDINERALVKLVTERKHLTDIIKMVAYQAESDLLALLRRHYARVGQEGGEPRCMSYSPLPAIYTSPIASCRSPWLPSARRIEPAPPRPSARCSTKRSSPALACGYASPCVRHLVSASPSRGPRSSATAKPSLPQPPDRAETGHLAAML